MALDNVDTLFNLCHDGYAGEVSRTNMAKYYGDVLVFPRIYFSPESPLSSQEL